MPSPFPGMDPYLESPAVWPTVHPRLITYLSDALNEILPAHYIARIGERLYVMDADRSIYPDVAVFRHRQAPPAGQAGGAVAVAAPAGVPWNIPILADEAREYFVDIVAVDNPSRIVTVIEVLSAANKASGSAGRRKYQTKQEEVLQSDSHLLEIDLLRRGEHTVLAQWDYLRREGYWDYLVCLHRAHSDTCQVWPASLRESLPEVRVPLAGEDPDVILDLQAAFTHCYDAGAYARTLDYRAEPDPPLDPADAAWADALLREKGLR